MSKRTVGVLLLLPVVLALCGVLWIPAIVKEVAYATETGKALAARQALTGEPFKVAQNLSLAYQEVAKAVGPSVVNIQSTKTIKPMKHERGWSKELPGEQDLERFFGDHFSRRFLEKPAPEESFQQRGLGTGVIISPDGYILTNNHVVSDADDIEVKVVGDGTYTAKVVGQDPKTDLAVLKIDAKDLVPAELGDSDKVQVGELVVAVGSPFELDHTVTAGIVSAKGRSNVGITDYEDFIQTDAAINPGNSGGPLVNLRGQVIGINTAIASKTGSSAGVGFTIPINLAKTVEESLQKTGRVERGWLGVRIQDLNTDMAKSFKYTSTHGVLVGGVNKDSPAEKAGLKDGDIITKYGEKPVENSMQLRGYVAASHPNDKVAIEVFRDGKLTTLMTTIGEQDAKAMAGVSPEKAASSQGPDRLGLAARNITPEQVQKLGLSDQKGVYISEVDPGSLADRAGLRPGDVVANVNGQPVTDLATFESAVKKLDPKEGMRFHVVSEGMSRYLMLKERGIPEHIK